MLLQTKAFQGMQDAVPDASVGFRPDNTPADNHDVVSCGGE